MKKIGLMLIVSAFVCIITGCTPAPTSNAGNAGNTGNTTAAANANAAAKPAAPPATKEALVAVEKSLWDGWAKKDAKPFQDSISDRAIGFGKTGRQDKAAIVKDITESKCDVKGYTFADEQMTPLGNDVAVLTLKATQDATCDGTKSHSPVYVASVYVREGDKWKNLVYMENQVSDPKKPIKYPAPKEAVKADTAPADAATAPLMAIENKAWAAWKQRDKAGVESVMSSNFAYFGDNGFMAKPDIVKLWGEAKCEGLDYTLGDAKGMSVTPDVSLVTYRADIKGKCNGNPVAPGVWVASFDIKEGDAWKNAFYIDVPRS